MKDVNGGISVPEVSVHTIGKKIKQPAVMKDEEWEVLDRKELGTIRLCLASSVAFNILKEKTIEGVISTLSKVFLMKPLFNMKMSEGGSLADHLNEFNTLTSQLSSVKVKFDDEVRDILIL